MDTDTQTAELKIGLEETGSSKVATGVLGMALHGFSDSGAELFTACMDGGIYQVNARSGESRMLGRHGSYASSVCWNPSGPGTLISSGYDGRLQWIDHRSGQLRHEVHAHNFWSWNMRLSPDGRMAASVSGQYLCGGYKYEPAPETEPCVRVYDAESASLMHSFSHLPPVLSVAFSPDSRYLAAANMMGDIRIWDLHSGGLFNEWNTPDFTSWGIIKSHHYIGGIFDLCFTPDGRGLVACGMGPMRDPMAGNGKQTWQLFDLTPTAGPAKKLEIRDDERGRGLMESIVFHPGGRFFVMAGRLAQGQWNTGFFNAEDGALIHSLNCGYRVTSVCFSEDGTTMVLGGAASQGDKKDGEWRDFGRITEYRIAV